MNINKKDSRLCALIGILGLTFSSLCLFFPILILGLLKLIPSTAWQVRVTRCIDKMVNGWVNLNNIYIDKIQKIQWEISGNAQSNTNNWHLVIANHQSWVDVFVLHHLFSRKMPTMKFFVKDTLKWIPLFGFAWWAMGCPFMKRYSQDYLRRKPHKRGKDIATAEKAMRLFKQTPVSIMNFVEGTRFTLTKQMQQQSPYQNLLKPKIGGISFSVQSMSERITSLIDVTILYPHSKISFWDFLCRRIDRLKVVIREIPIPAAFLEGKLLKDDSLKADFKEWLNEQWAIKDKLLGA